jgi:hypothetical protein
MIPEIWDTALSSRKNNPGAKAWGGHLLIALIRFWRRLDR